MNKQIEEFYEEDISDRKKKIPREQLDNNDRRRIDSVVKILSENNNLDAQDYHHSALIFQHGERPEHFEKAHELAMKAVQLGDESARWLAVASLDRFLLMNGKPQKYGTQFRLNNMNEWELAMPIDSSVSDEERSEWGVPPLNEALMTFKRKNNL